MNNLPQAIPSPKAATVLDIGRKRFLGALGEILKRFGLPVPGLLTLLFDVLQDVIMHMLFDDESEKATKSEPTLRTPDAKWETDVKEAFTATLQQFTESSEEALNDAFSDGLLLPTEREALFDKVEEIAVSLNDEFIFQHDIAAFVDDMRMLLSELGPKYTDYDILNFKALKTEWHNMPKPYDRQENLGMFLRNCVDPLIVESPFKSH